MRPPTKQARGRAVARALKAFGVVAGGAEGAAAQDERARASFPPPAPALAAQVRHALDSVLWCCPLLTLDLPGPPPPKARARTYTTDGGRVRTQTPDETRAYEQHVRLVATHACARDRWRVGGYDGARYVVDVAFVVPEATGDLDNRCKAIFDALNTVAWRDDKHVCQLYTTSRVAEPGERPRAEVRIWALLPQTTNEGETKP